MTTSTAHDDNATTWRDLADALTPEQIAYIEHWETHPDDPPNVDGSPRPEAERQRSLLFIAREFVEQNAAAALFADVAPPPEAGHHHPWEHVGDGAWRRFFTGTSRKVGDVEVFVTGMQSSDDSIVRRINVAGAEDMSAADARATAALLIEAADELDGYAAVAAIAACPRCDDQGRIRRGTTADGIATYRASLCRHDQERDDQ